MIISASRRTDIPAFYAEWFANRVREGFVCVRNPMNAHQVSRVSLDPALVDCIVFWTKNPAPMLEHLDAFAAYPYYFQATLTGYGRDVEGNLPDKHEVLLPAMKELAHRIGPERVVWRYDPILFNEKYTPQYHLRAVREIANTAIRLKTGARGLRTIIENLMTDVMYDIPSNDGISEVRITRECVLGTAKPEVIKKSA